MYAVDTVQDLVKHDILVGESSVMATVAASIPYESPQELAAEPTSDCGDFFDTFADLVYHVNLNVDLGYAVLVYPTPSP